MRSTKDIYIEKTENMGRGVYTNVPIKKGEIIEVSPAIILSPGDQHFIENTLLQYYTFECDDNVAMSALALGFGSLFNHSDAPNAEFEVYSDKQLVVFKATRDIKEGEQIFIHYGWDDEFEEKLN